MEALLLRFGIGRHESLTQHTTHRASGKLAVGGLPIQSDKDDDDDDGDWVTVWSGLVGCKAICENVARNFNAKENIRVLRELLLWIRSGPIGILNQ